MNYIQILLKNILKLIVNLYSIIKQLLNKSKEFIKFIFFFRLVFPCNHLMRLVLCALTAHESFYMKSAVNVNC